jgi:uncharacterized protein YcbX
MPIINSLHLYPIKSCAGISLEQATLSHAGLESRGVGDREWMLVDADSGLFLTQRQAPRMALIRPILAAGALRVEAPGQASLEIPLAGGGHRSASRPVKVWTHECSALDEGDAAATWFSAYLGRPLRLVRFDPAHKRASNREWTGDIEALNRFSDGYPILLISQASLDDLNDRLAEAGREALPMNRFRPNIVLGGVGPYEEDYLLALTSDGLVFKPVKPCPRCPIPSIEQSTGVIGPDPLDILSQYRSDERTGGVVFGQNLVTLQGQGSTLKVGQVFEPEWNF